MTSGEWKCPDYFEPLVGWRVWRWLTPIEYNSIWDNPKKGQPRLTALANDYVWEPGKPIQSCCTHCKSPNKPTMQNGTGMYAFKSLDHLLRDRADYGTYNTIVVGRVFLWGTIVECQFGYRAEFAYPKDFLVGTEQVAEEIRQLWKLPCDVGNIRELIAAAKVRRIQKMEGV